MFPIVGNAQCRSVRVPGGADNLRRQLRRYEQRFLELWRMRNHLRFWRSLFERSVLDSVMFTVRHGVCWRGARAATFSRITPFHTGHSHVARRSHCLPGPIGLTLRVMNRSRLLAAALAVMMVAATAGATAGGISGVVLNATCPGPCSVPPKPLPPYDGKNLVVIVRKLPERTLVARLFPTDGEFEVGVGPGLYRVRAHIRETSAYHCWEGSSRRVEVSGDVVSRVRLRVRNDCVL
jgi:hypothetical protein